jgi:hypothetical protein
MEAAMAIPSSPAYHWSIDYAVRYLAKVRGLTLDHAIDDFQRAIERGELSLSGAFYDKTGTLVRYVVKISYFRSVLYVGIKDGRVTVIHRGGIIGDPNIGNTAHSVPSSRVKRLWPQPATASTRKRKPATMLLRVASAFKEIYGVKGMRFSKLTRRSRYGPRTSTSLSPVSALSAAS